MRTIIFDFDNTLFDTTMFKADLFGLMLESRVTAADMETCYEAALAESGGNYDARVHAAFLEERIGKALAPKIEAFLQQSLERYLNPGAFDVLLKLRERGHSLVLLTKGARSFQETKIQGSGIARFFDSVHICDALKEDLLQSKSFGDEAYFINDNWNETERIMRIFPDLSYILYVRKDASQFYNEANIPISTVRSLGELLAIIK